MVKRFVEAFDRLPRWVRAGVIAWAAGAFTATALWFTIWLVGR